MRFWVIKEFVNQQLSDQVPFFEKVVFNYMKIKLEKRYRLKNRVQVIECRRLVTPFFYFKLKTRVYQYHEWKSPYLAIPMGLLLGGVHLQALPKGQYRTYKEWQYKGKTVHSKSLLRRLNIMRAMKA